VTSQMVGCTSAWMMGGLTLILMKNRDPFGTAIVISVAQTSSMAPSSLMPVMRCDGGKNVEPSGFLSTWAMVPLPGRAKVLPGMIGGVCRPTCFRTMIRGEGPRRLSFYRRQRGCEPGNHSLGNGWKRPSSSDKASRIDAAPSWLAEVEFGRTAFEVTHKQWVDIVWATREPWPHPRRTELKPEDGKVRRYSWQGGIDAGLVLAEDAVRRWLEDDYG
jgi:hypothetical protein